MSSLTTSEGTTNLRGMHLDDLPTGRTPALAAALAPGATDNTPNGNQVTVSGGFACDNSFLIDGVDVDDNLFGDALEETQVLTSGISAKYGPFSGGVVNVVTKRGGNQFSGTFPGRIEVPVSLEPFSLEGALAAPDLRATRVRLGRVVIGWLPSRDGPKLATAPRGPETRTVNPPTYETRPWPLAAMSIPKDNGE